MNKIIITHVYKMKKNLYYFLLFFGVAIFSGCTTIVDTITPMPSPDCQQCLPRYPLYYETRWLCRSLSDRGAILYFEKNRVRIVFPESSNFKMGASLVNEDFRTNLEAVAAVLEQYPMTRAHIIGYSDNSDSIKYNQSLALRRAESVAYYLLSQGVSKKQLSVEGNKIKGASLAGRRVEIVIYKDKEYIRNIYHI